MDADQQGTEMRPEEQTNKKEKRKKKRKFFPKNLRVVMGVFPRIDDRSKRIPSSTLHDLQLLR